MHVFQRDSMKENEMETGSPMDGVWRIRKGLSSDSLKVMAVLFMLIDHIAATLLQGQECYWLLRGIGRLSFPIFCFLAAEGIAWTGNLRRYELRMGAFALISEVFYDLAFYHTLWNPAHQNVFFTLFLGVLAGGRLRKIEEQRADPKNRRSLPAIFLNLLVILICFPLANVLHTDYGLRGVALIFVFYASRRYGIWRYVAAVIFMSAFWWGKFQLYALLAIPILFLYSGKKGRALPKYAFYVFYPLHLFLLWGLANLL